jgi:hypothetical protein
MALQKTYDTLDDFYTLSDADRLSWYARHPDELVRDVHEQVANNETLTAEYICSRLPVVKGLAVPAADAAASVSPVPLKIGVVRSIFCANCPSKSAVIRFSWKKPGKNPPMLVAPPAKYESNKPQKGRIVLECCTKC